MRIVKHIAVLILSVVMLAATTGGQFYAHHCSSMQRSTFLWKNAEGGCGGSSCSLHAGPVEQGSVIHFSPEPCCETESIYLSWETDVQLTKTLLLQAPVSQEVNMQVPVASVLPVENNFLVPDAPQHAPPLFSGRELIIFIQQPKIPSPFTV